MVGLTLAAAVGGLFTPSAAEAHSDLESSSPSHGAIVDEPVDEVELVFTAPIEPEGSRFEVADFERNRRDQPNAEFSPDEVTVILELQDAIEQGRVEVTYVVRGADAHRRSGAISFFVGDPPQPTAVATATAESDPATGARTDDLAAGAAPRTVSLSPTSDGSAIDRGAVDRMIGIQDLTRGSGYAAATLAIGGAIYLGFVRRRAPDIRLRRIITGASVGCGLSALALLATQASITELGRLGALVDPLAWLGELEGSFGLGITSRLLGAAGLATAVAALGGGRSRLAVGSLGLLALSFPLLGHGVSLVPRWLGFSTSIVHVVAVSVWAGGLVMLLSDLNDQNDPLPRGEQIRLIVRYGRAAAAAVCAAVLSGVVLAVRVIDGFDELTDTNYGRRLLLKIAIVAVLVALGAANRYVFLPRLRRSNGSVQLERLLITGAAEVGIMTFVLILTMSLTSA